MVVLQSLVSLITALVVGCLVGYFWVVSLTYLLNPLCNESRILSWALIFLTLFSTLKIIIVSIIFYLVLHHTQLNFILVLSAFLCVVGMGLKKAIAYGRS